MNEDDGDTKLEQPRLHVAAHALSPEQVAQILGHWDATFRTIGVAMRQLAEECLPAVREFANLAARCRVLPDGPPADPMERALWLRRTRNTGPTDRRRAPRRIDPSRTR